ncbi:GerAB/ArcD/ProY family transporter [Ectobacillus ponti]|uniref:Spore germination protein n=1 Tax=Ectobacillus ponti TaxID=2961894 RepID=A0AA41XD93_9BACI|nr:spore germination protein [Ectobacillus ponti]
MEAKLTEWQVVGLIVSTILPTAVLTVPKAVVPYSLQSSWLSILAAAALALVVARVACAVCERYPGQTIFRIIERLLGKTAAMGIGLLLSFYYFTVAFYVLCQFSDFMTATVMPETPAVAFQILLMIGVVYAIYLGLEAIAKANNLVLIFSLFTLCLSAVLLFKEAHAGYLLPLLEMPFPNIIMGAYAPLGWLSEVTVIWLLAPSLVSGGSVRKTACLGVLITGAALLGVLLESLLVYEPYQLTLLNYPTFNVFRKIGIEGVLERMDPFFIAVWTSSVMMKLTVFVFGAVYCLCEVLGIRHRGPVLLAVALLVTVYASASWENSAQLSLYGKYTFPVFVYMFNIVIPILLLLVASIKKRSIKA